MPQEKRFCVTHQWVEQISDTEVQVGISAHAEQALGDVVYVELPEAGQKIAQGDCIGAVESVKAASEINAPVSGILRACNEQLAEMPELLNEAPLTTWVYRLTVDPAQLAAEWSNLMTAEAYEAFLQNS